jgi:ribosomal protein S18 acetylase RimI-like enzyme
LSAPLLKFRPIDLPRDAAKCVSHRVDATICSYGNSKPFFSEAGSGGEGYLDALAATSNDLPGGCVFAMVGGLVVGQIELMRDRDDPGAAKVNLFYLAASWRNRGFGTQLEKYAVEFLQAKGFRRAWLRVSPTNVQATRFYLKHGWTFVGESRRGTDTLVMERPLGDATRAAV